MNSKIVKNLSAAIIITVGLLTAIPVFITIREANSFWGYVSFLQAVAIFAAHFIVVNCLVSKTEPTFLVELATLILAAYTVGVLVSGIIFLFSGFTLVGIFSLLYAVSVYIASKTTLSLFKE